MTDSRICPDCQADSSLGAIGIRHHADCHRGVIYLQLGLFGEYAPTIVPGFGQTIGIGTAGRCDCGETLCILTPCGPWSSEHGRTVPVWGCLDCNNYCDAGEHLTQTDDVSICPTCDACSDCCDCYWCEQCEESFRSDPCDICHRCDGCCECVECSSRYCSMRYSSGGDQYICGECEQCESCCDCIRCHYCGEIVDSVCDAHGECFDCCDSEDCQPGTDCEDPASEPAAGSIDSLTYDRSLYFRTGRTFGVELEHAGIGMRTAVQAIAAANLSVSDDTSYRHTDSDSEWKIVSDSSVNSGQECVSPILAGDDGLAQLECAMSALVASGASVNRSCGTHVHLGTDDLTALEISRIVRFYDRHHDLIDSFHAPSRRGRSQWSGPYQSHEREAIDTAAEGGSKSALGHAGARYRSVNLQSLVSHGTIEFRQHGGTLNYRKLSAWIGFLMALVTFARDDVDSVTFARLSDLLTALGQHGLTNTHATYLASRAADLA